MGKQHEVTKKQPLLNKRGHIMEPGWAKQPIWEYNRDQIHAPAFLRKEWDYYLVIGDGFGVAFTISDLGYSGMISVSYLDLEQGWEHTEMDLDLFPIGNKYQLGAHSNDGYAEYQGKKIHLRFDTRAHKRRIQCVFADFYNGQELRADIVLDQPDMDTMCIATPWKEKPTAFYYNQKINCMPARGNVHFEGVRHSFDPKLHFGILDWGRGVWTYDNVWYWGTASAYVNGKPFGMNLGYGFSDRSYATENMIFYDGVCHKLDEVVIQIPKDAGGNYAYMSPWCIFSTDRRLDGIFTPILDRNADLNLLIVATMQHQVFGSFNGMVTLDNGEKLEIHNLICAIEHVHNRY